MPESTDETSTGLAMPLPLPGSPSSSWAIFRERLKATFNGANPRVCIAFWFLGELIIQNWLICLGN